jgi:hypothetical protein
VKHVLKIAFNAPPPPLVLPAILHTSPEMELVQLHPTTYNKSAVMDSTSTLSKTFVTNADPHVPPAPKPQYAKHACQDFPYQMTNVFPQAAQADTLKISTTNVRPVNLLAIIARASVYALHVYQDSN